MLALSLNLSLDLSLFYRLLCQIARSSDDNRLMVETYSDLTSPDATGEDAIGWRCVNCADYVDPLVLLNRWAQQEGGFLRFGWWEDPRHTTDRSLSRSVNAKKR